MRASTHVSERRKMNMKIDKPVVEKFPVFAISTILSSPVATAILKSKHGFTRSSKTNTGNRNFTVWNRYFQLSVQKQRFRGCNLHFRFEDQKRNSIFRVWSRHLQKRTVFCEFEVDLEFIILWNSKPKVKSWLSSGFVHNTRHDKLHNYRTRHGYALWFTDASNRCSNRWKVKRAITVLSCVTVST